MIGMKFLLTAFVWCICSALYMALTEKDPTTLRTAVVVGPTIISVLYLIWS